MAGREDAQYRGEMVNRSCGDEVALFFDVTDQGAISNLSFDGRGCSICIGSADILCENLEGKTLTQAREISRRLVDALKQGGEPSEEVKQALPGDVKALLSLTPYPMRQKCVTLSWNIILDLCDTILGT